MPYYRLYCLDGANKIETGEWIDANSDEDAVMIARAKKRRAKGELWHAERLITTIPAYRESEWPGLDHGH